MHTFQSGFHLEWSKLRDHHVRSLAWLLTSPDLLDSHSGVWLHQITTLPIHNKDKLRSWLFALDAQPTALHEAIKVHRFLRLGHYAERLLAFYFKHEGMLFGHGIQVHNEKLETIGEFDYLLYSGSELLHLELATKFYLFFQESSAQHPPNVYDCLGPNLNDTLGAKMQKILLRQLTLSQHEAARKLITQKIVSAKALIKGWLFYRITDKDQSGIQGVSPKHCMGFWWTLEEFEHLAIPSALVLERLHWMAPAQTEPNDVMDKGMVVEYLQRHFVGDTTPVMVAIMRRNGELMQEFCRGMVVANNWPEKAALLRR